MKSKEAECRKISTELELVRAALAKAETRAN